MLSIAYLRLGENDATTVLSTTAMNTWFTKAAKSVLISWIGFLVLTHCSTLRQKMNLGIRSRILTSAWAFGVVFILSPHACNMNLLMMSGCIPGQSLISFN